MPSVIWSSSVDMPNLCGQRLQQLRTDHLRRALDRAARHPGVAAVAARAGRRLVGVDGGDVHLVDAERLLDDLPGQGGEALAGLDRGADDRGHAVVTLTVAVETSSVPSAPSMCTMPSAVADAAAHRARFARALGAAGQQPLRLGRVLGQRGERAPVRPAGVRRPGAGQVTVWPVGSRSPVAMTLRSRSSAGSMPSFGGQLVHLALVGGAHLHRALAAHMAGRRVVGAHGPAVDEGVRDDVRAAGEGDGGGQRRRTEVSA